VYGPFPYDSPNLGNFIQADGTPGLAYALTQTINALTIGQSYDLTFYQAGGQELYGLGGDTEQWQVSLGSQTQLSSLMTVPQGAVVPWESQSMTFTASATSEVLSFFPIGIGGQPPMLFLDGVDLESNVPEPSATLLLGGIGTVIALGKLGRRLLRSSRPSTVS
jgi:hypothetical protein